ncbi:MAG: hypothetical protein KJ601_05190 [Nanoarchaeota archaeon]|nr:hypothetical protein [Nanoarchaeota archaeon]MBU1704529.1 hypothetical protein [Nanoarchaeota archaeon]
MAVEMGTCLGFIAPFYNLVLVAIAVILFIKLFRMNKKNILAWKLIFLAVLIYIVEQVLAVTNSLLITSVPRITNSFFEMAIITIFIYVLLVQKEFVKK